VGLLEITTGPATDRQRELAGLIGLTVLGTEPRDVVGVMLEEHLRPLIWGLEPARATDRQRDFLTELGASEADDAGLFKRTASAWIAHYLALRTIDCLRGLALVRGDAVIKRSTWRDPENGRLHESLDYEVVASIGSNGLVYFRGGNGKCGWPSSLERATPTTHREDYPQIRELADETSG
jgi:hypothetical protein